MTAYAEPQVDPSVLTRDYFAVEDSEGGRFWLFARASISPAPPPCRAGTLYGLFA